jgi:hypothetical protein
MAKLTRPADFRPRLDQTQSTSLASSFFCTLISNAPARITRIEATSCWNSSLVVFCYIIPRILILPPTDIVVASCSASVRRHIVLTASDGETPFSGVILNTRAFLDLAPSSRRT